jgi:hypothetical protein
MASTNSVKLHKSRHCPHAMHRNGGQVGPTWLLAVGYWLLASGAPDGFGHTLHPCVAITAIALASSSRLAFHGGFKMRLTRNHADVAPHIFVQ